MQSFDLVAHLKRQRAFSRGTFGPGARVNGVLDHIRKELIEIEQDPADIAEWVDLILLALDGAWRCADANDIPIEVVVASIEAKQSQNERRQWPDWRTANPDRAIEHVDLGRGAVFGGIARDDASVGDGVRVGGAARKGCPYVACPSPYLCNSGCKFNVAKARP